MPCETSATLRPQQSCARLHRNAPQCTATCCMCVLSNDALERCEKSACGFPELDREPVASHVTMYEIIVYQCAQDSSHLFPACCWPQKREHLCCSHHHLVAGSDHTLLVQEDRGLRGLRRHVDLHRRGGKGFAPPHPADGGGHRTLLHPGGHRTVPALGRGGAVERETVTLR